MFAMQKSFKDRYEMVRTTLKNHAEKAKQGMHLVVEVGTGSAVGAGLGALDQAKGTVVNASDYGFKQHRIGPIPTSAVVGAAGLVGAMYFPWKSMESKMALGVAHGGLISTAYVGGARLWMKHKAKAK